MNPPRIGHHNYVFEKLKSLEKQRLLDSKNIKKISIFKTVELGRKREMIIDEDKNENIVNLVKLITDKS